LHGCCCCFCCSCFLCRIYQNAQITVVAVVVVNEVGVVVVIDVIFVVVQLAAVVDNNDVAVASQVYMAKVVVVFENVFCCKCLRFFTLMLPYLIWSWWHPLIVVDKKGS